MKRNTLTALGIGAGLLVALLGYSMTYSVKFSDVAIVTTFGKAGRVQVEPGLHVKMPYPFQAVKMLDRRNQIVESRLETQATRDGLQVVVQAFAMWRVARDEQGEGIRRFHDNFASMDDARAQMEGRLRNAMAAVSEFNFSDLIGRNTRLAEAERRIHERLMAETQGGRGLRDLGIDVQQVGLSQVLLPIETTKSVIERMQQERELRAQIERDKGESAAAAITSDANAKSAKILAYANRIAFEIRAKGDALAGDSVRTMSEDPEFAVFLIWLDALTEITSGHTTIFLPTTIAPLHLLNQPRGAGVPLPDEDVFRDLPARSRPAGAEAVTASDTPGRELVSDTSTSQSNDDSKRGG